MKLDYKYIVIAILALIIILMRACGPKPVPQEPIVTIKYDTIWKKTHDTIVKTVTISDVQYIPVPGHTPSNNIDTCKARYASLLKELSKKTTYKDTIKLDSIGTITVIDTVWKNELGKRTYLRDYKIPLVTKTVTIIKQADPKRQLYIGGNLFGDKRTLQLFTPGLIYKDRKDRIYQVNVGVNFDGTLTYGLGTYWKINLHK